ncbi:N-acetylmuramoyl-L-alanine amidase [Actinoplanes sp. NEAU-A12]|uniref:N-acetylmuramoyl-L-alanine amidase n=1 Tax=Actinoplanes sandaracinus TaxID=3045177 RepID=A0ABT6WNG4_9ACTN|nr:N-acetylmuramoyl-L-alanine amidase [Actinoplanes sandaracinus]MDI6101251.1 N-acetylmuramoyl-L-alanine amidase [Actinoplanes sandaracinus]
MRRNRLTARLVAALVAATPAVAVAIAGGAAVQPPVTTAPAGRTGPVLQTFALTERSPEATGRMRLVSARTAGRPRTAELAQRVTDPFSLVGVTWADPRSGPSAAIEVRTRRLDTGTWAPWQPLETDNPDASAGGPGVRGASDPLWVGPSDGVQARVVAAGAAELPDGLRVDLINPDAPRSGSAYRLMAIQKPAVQKPAVQKPAVQKPAAQKPAARTEAKTPGLVLPLRPVPRMVTRAGWGADESIVEEPPEYTGAVHVAFVHHTASGNSYDCAQSPSIVRGIENYQVKSKGWNDIGYNFLVDKCGRIFEGRAGGVHRSVLGAHTLGFNANATAIAVIGDFRSTAVPAAARASVAQLAAYKLGAWNNPPLGKVGLVSGGSDRYPAGQTAILHRISGHRDTGRTECPGNSLYSQLPWIRGVAGAAPAGLRYRGVNGATEHGGKYYTKGPAGPAWDLTTATRMMDRFEVWVDGRLSAAARNGHRQAGIRLEPGTHTVTVRGVHLSGKIASTTTQVIADPVAPSFSETPLVSLREGTVGATAPVRIGWAASDTSGLTSVRVRGADTGNLPGATRALTATARLGDPATWAVTATDRAGNSASDAVTRTPVLLTEAEAPRTGSWRAVRDQEHLGAEAVAASAAGASLTWTFTGSSAALVAGRTAGSGRVRIYVDGEFQGIVDLRSASSAYRQAVWTRTWRSSGTHTVRAQVEGTTGRPSVVLDGLVYLR